MMLIFFPSTWQLYRTSLNLSKSSLLLAFTLAYNLKWDTVDKLSDFLKLFILIYVYSININNLIN